MHTAIDGVRFLPVRLCDLDPRRLGSPLLLIAPTPIVLGEPPVLLY